VQIFAQGLRNVDLEFPDVRKLAQRGAIVDLFRLVNRSAAATVGNAGDERSMKKDGAAIPGCSAAIRKPPLLLQDHEKKRTGGDQCGVENDKTQLFPCVERNEDEYRGSGRRTFPER